MTTVYLVYIGNHLLTHASTPSTYFKLSRVGAYFVGGVFVSVQLVLVPGYGTYLRLIPDAPLAFLLCS